MKKKNWKNKNFSISKVFLSEQWEEYNYRDEYHEKVGSWQTCQAKETLFCSTDKKENGKYAFDTLSSEMCRKVLTLLNKEEIINLSLFIQIFNK